MTHWLSHEEGFVFIIEIDPHKGSHTAAVLDDIESVIGELRVVADGASGSDCCASRPTSLPALGPSSRLERP
jgi:hypothetical protein